MARPKGQDSDLKDIRKKIAEHGLEEIEVILDDQLGQQRSVKSARLLILMELLFQKAVQEKNLGSIEHYMDRILGKPKESLSLTDESEGLGRLSDKQLLQRLGEIMAGCLTEEQRKAILEAKHQGGSGGADN